DGAERALVPRGGQIADERGEAALLVAEKLRHGRRIGATSEGGYLFHDLIADEEKLERLRRVKAPVLARLILGHADGGRDPGGGIVELGEILEDLVEGVE